MPLAIIVGPDRLAVTSRMLSEGRMVFSDSDRTYVHFDTVDAMREALVPRGDHLVDPATGAPCRCVEEFYAEQWR